MARPALRARAGRVLRRFSLKQISTLMGVVGILLIVAATAYIAASERRVLFAEAHDHADQSAAFLADHARRLFEVSDLVLHAAGASLVGMSWSAIDTSADIVTALRRMDDMLPYVDAVFAADPTGHIHITTLTDAPASYALSDRSIVEQAKTGQRDRLLIGEPIVGRVSHRPTFLVARRREATDGSFDGLVGAAMTLDYFTDYWKTLDKRNDEQIALVRADTGSVLARYPETSDVENGGPAFRAATTDGARKGAFTPGPHMAGTFEQVGDLPIYMTVVFRDAVIIREWHAVLRRLVPPALTALVVLCGIMALAHRLGRREELARRQIETARALLSAANARLEHRVAVRTADLVESNREIQRFAYIVSHDLRAPLVNIMGFTSELKTLRDEALNDHDGTPSEARKARMRADFDEAFGFIGSSIDKMDRLIKAILSLSRNGQRVFKPEALDMDALMRSVADGVAHRLNQSGATLTIGPLPAVTADRIAIEQVFANLVDNAVKYLKPDVAGVITVTGNATGDAVAYTVTDNGRGIDAKDHERVFELFRRAGRQDQPGEGIGLASVRSLIRRLQGTIVLDSAVGAGCRFTVTLPAVAAATNTDGAP